MPIAIATCTYSLPAHDLDVTTREVFEVSGERGTWEAAQAACEIPDGAFVLHWTRA